MTSAGRAWHLAAVGAVALFAFVLYRATLLPGLDLGDTASFQVVVGSPFVSPRDGYPLYFAVAGLVVGWIGGDPARGLNLMSAIAAATACGILTLVAADVSGSIVAGAGAALLLAGSYTFWSQSIIAEVYALHVLFIGLTLWLLLHWERRPTVGRLALFFAVYALGFGNHLSMILLLPAYAAFLLVVSPDGWRSVFRPRVVILAIGLAAIGALPYAWNVRTQWLRPFPPNAVWAGLRMAWFDITKADWRDTMVMNVPQALIHDRLSMYVFDLRQQFGVVGIALSLVGAGTLLADRWRLGMLMLGVYAANAVFAFGYNVGDTHVFYLPSHVIVALLAACGAAGVARRAPRLLVTAPAVLLIAYAGIRVYAEYPALDRSDDTRPTDVLMALTSGLDDAHAILLTDLSWQLQNGLTYFARRVKPNLVYARMPDVLLYAPALVEDNLTIGREVVLTRRAREAFAGAYGPLIPTKIDPRTIAPRISDLIDGLPTASRYALTVLKPTRDYSLDRDDLLLASARLTAGQLTHVPGEDYVVVAGRIGAPPVLVAGSDAPFRQTADVGGVSVTIRMDSWLAADTIRRMGFGHVLAARRHTLIVERGVSFVAFDESGVALRRGYAAGLYEPQPRYLCYR